jgi:E3 ubiquitin-protein ligase HECTD1
VHVFITCFISILHVFLLMQEEEYEVNSAGTSKRRTWDDEFVLKRQFSALIPAFDPRPGRTNVNQTQDFEIPAPGTLPSPEEQKQEHPEQDNSQPKLQLWLKGPGLPGVSCCMRLLDALLPFVSDD